VTGLVFDAGGLIAVDRGDRRVLDLVGRVADLDGRIVIPATALAQVLRVPARQARLSSLIRRTFPDVVPLDRRDAGRVGRLLAEAGTSDVVDAHVAVVARRLGHIVVTSDPDDLGHLDPSLRLVAI
jgi:predicted nucleic acid-binding protein